MKKILFLCMGNICRSPAAHCVFQELVNHSSHSNDFLIDSAGTINFHSGSAPDGRMQDALRKRKIPIIGKSRALTINDLEVFDLILAMDHDNLNDAMAMDPEHNWHDKIKLFSNYCTDPLVKEIPDPYYSYGDGFELVLDLIEDGCKQLYKSLNKEL
mgnify:FL=1|tara:strand:- start:272 stop:742 length:471 start_codon:yes stop_codon:yes gene_type:complete